MCTCVKRTKPILLIRLLLRNLSTPLLESNTSVVLSPLYVCSSRTDGHLCNVNNSIIIVSACERAFVCGMFWALLEYAFGVCVFVDV